MAKLILSDIISDIRGTVGTHTYSKWKATHLVKNRSVNYRTAHESPFVAPYKKFIAEVSQYWTNGLSQAQRDGWEAFADHIAARGYPYYGSDVYKLVGWHQYGGTMSGVNVFVLTNMLRWSIGKTNILEDDPIIFGTAPRPEFVALDFIPGPPRLLRITIARPATLPEPSWLRIFCRGHRLAHLIMAKTVQVLVGAAIPWDDTYNCTVEPPAATPAWTLGGADHCVAAAGIITIDTATPGGGAQCNYYLDVAGISNATGWIREFKMKVGSAVAGTQSLGIVVRDGVYEERLLFADDNIRLLIDGDDFDMDTTDDYHVYQIAGETVPGYPGFYNTRRAIHPALRNII